MENTEITQAYQELRKAINELELLDINFTVLSNNTNLDLVKHATVILKNYKKYMEGDKNTGIEKIDLE